MHGAIPDTLWQNKTPLSNNGWWGHCTMVKQEMLYIISGSFISQFFLLFRKSILLFRNSTFWLTPISRSQDYSFPTVLAVLAYAFVLVFCIFFLTNLLYLFFSSILQACLYMPLCRLLVGYRSDTWIPLSPESFYVASRAFLFFSA